MNYRKFKDASVAEIGLGTWQLGSSEWGTVSEEEAITILQAYIDAGGNFIDTADIYGMGISEKIIGKFLKKGSINQKIYIATKLGRREDNGYGWPQNFSYEVMKKHVEDSLEHLEISQLFLDQFHCIPQEQLQAGDVFDNFRKLKEEGLIRHWGASVVTLEEALICLEQEGLASLQVIFNLFRQHLAEELFEKASNRGVALIIRVPLASGLLTGKFDENTTFPEDDHRYFNADGEAFSVGETFSGIEFKKGVRFAREIEALMPDDRMPQWALRWILDHPEVTTVIPGASKVSQVVSNADASLLDKISKARHTKLRDLYDEKIRPNIRGRI